MDEATEEEPAVRPIVVTCLTDGCGNAGAGILIEVAGDPPVVCGVCGQAITEIEEA